MQLFYFKLFRFLLLFSLLIPISLKVTLDVVKYAYAQFINWDAEMYDPKVPFPFPLPFSVPLPFPLVSVVLSLSAFLFPFSFPLIFFLFWVLFYFSRCDLYEIYFSCPFSHFFCFRVKHTRMRHLPQLLKIWHKFNTFLLTKQVFHCSFFHF